MSRLPKPGGDNGTWGNILNDFLAIEHNSDGTLKKAGDIASAKAAADQANAAVASKADQSALDLVDKGTFVSAVRKELLIPASRLPSGLNASMPPW